MLKHDGQLLAPWDQQCSAFAHIQAHQMLLQPAPDLSHGAGWLRACCRRCPTIQHASLGWYLAVLTCFQSSDVASAACWSCKTAAVACSACLLVAACWAAARRASTASSLLAAAARSSASLRFLATLLSLKVLLSCLRKVRISQVTSHAWHTSCTILVAGPSSHRSDPSVWDGLPARQQTGTPASCWVCAQLLPQGRPRQ